MEKLYTIGIMLLVIGAIILGGSIAPERIVSTSESTPDASAKISF